MAVATPVLLDSPGEPCYDTLARSVTWNALEWNGLENLLTGIFVVCAFAL